MIEQLRATRDALASGAGSRPAGRHDAYRRGTVLVPVPGVRATLNGTPRGDRWAMAGCRTCRNLPHSGEPASSRHGVVPFPGRARRSGVSSATPLVAGVARRMACGAGVRAAAEAATRGTVEGPRIRAVFPGGRGGGRPVA
jgi:hypothetical protein